jgi:hypothetical protein
MKRSFLQLSMALLLGLSITSCKSKNANNNANNPGADTASTYTAPPVVVSDDETLRNNLKDATKDFPGVTATANNGEVTLTGHIKRDDLPRLLSSVNALNPKKVNNQLTIQ